MAQSVGENGALFTPRAFLFLSGPPNRRAISLVFFLIRLASP